MEIINEGLDYHDLKGQIEPICSVDEYVAKLGDDSNIVTLTFILKSKEAAEDLTSWFELGYDFVLDASVSEGQLSPGKWLVFVEMKRRSNVPKKIVELLTDLKTLTDINITDWTVKVDEHDYDAEVDTLKQVITLTPEQYKLEKGNEGELNEMRQIAGLDTKNIYDNIDEEIKKYISNAGL